jgi:hypothetical protein
MPRSNVVTMEAHRRTVRYSDPILRETLGIAQMLQDLCRNIEASNLPLDRKAAALSELVVVGNGLKRAFDAVLDK